MNLDPVAAATDPANATEGSRICQCRPGLRPGTRSRRARRLASIVLTVLCGALAAVAPLYGDWLVTRDGARIETQGQWKIKGRMVIFTQTNGTLSSLRLSEVDLEASAAAASEEPEVQPAPPEQEPEKDPVLVLTDADVGHPNLAMLEALEQEEAEGETGGEAEGDAEQEQDQEQEGERTDGAAPVRVVSWEDLTEREGGGVAIQGVLANQGEDMATELTLRLTLYDEAGNRLGETDARLTSRSLMPGRQTEFRADFPTIFAFDRVDFQIAGNSYRARAQEQAQEPPATPF
jgi:hypothetical protein